MQRAVWFGKTLLAPVALLVMALPAGAAVVYYTSYTSTLDVCGNAGYGNCAPDGAVNPTPSVDHIMLLEDGSMSWAFGANSEGPSTTNNPFSFSSPPLKTLILGLVSNLPGDTVADTPHMLLFMDPDDAASAVDKTWDAFFPNTPESALIAALSLATSGQNPDVVNPGLDFISYFAATDCAACWFTTGGDFSALTFTTPASPDGPAPDPGTIVGSGTSTISQEGSPDGTVPEPATCAMMLGGIALAAGLKRRQASRR
jgi:hypothetical protein